MRFWTIPLAAIAIAVLFTSLHAFQLTFREYQAIEYNNFPLPPDYQQKTEFVFARLMYPPAPTARFDRTRGGRRGRGFFGLNGVGDWSGGNSSWTQDYPRADRHFLTALRRLTRIDARSVEQPVNLNDEDDVFNWPFLYAVRPGEWELTDAQAKKFHDFLDRGGFFFTDDFWGTFEWGVFMQSMSKVLPNGQPVD